MRVVLDANVVIAAAATRGLCEAVFELCLERHRLLVCEGLLAEIRQILLGKLRLSPDLTDEYLRLLRDVAEMLVLEDSENGCKAAVAAGAIVVAVPGGHSRRHNFTGARFIAESLADPRIYALLG